MYDIGKNIRKNTCKNYFEKKNNVEGSSMLHRRKTIVVEKTRYTEYAVLHS